MKPDKSTEMLRGVLEQKEWLIIFKKYFEKYIREGKLASEELRHPEKFKNI